MNLSIVRYRLRATQTYLSEILADLPPLEQAILELEVKEDAIKLQDLHEWMDTLRGRCSLVAGSALSARCDRLDGMIRLARREQQPWPSERIDAALGLLGQIGAIARGMVDAIGALPKEGNPDDSVSIPVPDLPPVQDPSPPRPVPRSGPKFSLPPGLLEDFVEEAREHLAESERLLLALERTEGGQEQLREMFRRLHTVKGGAGLVLSALDPEDSRRMALDHTRDLAHRLETLFQHLRDAQLKVSGDLISLALQGIDGVKHLIEGVASCQERDGRQRISEFQQAFERLAAGAEQTESLATTTETKTESMRPPASESQTLRIEKMKLDLLMDQASQLLITRGALLHLSKRLLSHVGHGALAVEMDQVSKNFVQVSRGLQDTIMDLRLQEVRTVFQRFPRVVRDLAQQQGKQIRLEICGEETKLDKTVIERIGDPLMHMIRNAADHGIEPSEERRQAGKPEEGTISLKAEQRGTLIWLRIEDDGRGLDPERLKQKAIEIGLLSAEAAEGMSPRQAFDLIFLPGFSTAQQVTDVSGRGVGMDVVRTNISQLNGTIEIDSQPGQGTRMTIQLPMTLAVADGLLFEAGGETFAIPVVQVVEAIKVPKERIRSAIGRELLYLRGEVLPIIRLEHLLRLKISEDQGEEVHVLILRGHGERQGVVIDRPLREQEIIVKPLHEALQALPCLSGATILGDGRVLLILDADKLVEQTHRHYQALSEERS